MANSGMTALRVDPQTLITTSEAFQGSGSNIASMTEEMMSIVTGLTSVWQSEAQMAYVSKFQMLEDDIQKMIRMIQEHVSDLQEMAQHYSEGENQALTLTESLSGDVII